MEDIPETVAVALAEQPDVKAKLQRRLDSVTFPTLNEPRKGKLCAVFDIDHTLFALGQTGERATDLARPYLHHLLAGVYEQYDIVIWSATGATAVRAKMEGLGVLGHPAYKIVCLMDYRAMLTVTTEKYGTFDCKPLAFLWARFPDHYNESNTVIIDDLRRNFVLNPQNGLIIRPFYGKRGRDEYGDVELAYLLGWLLYLAT